MSRVSFLGLGVMGFPMAGHLLGGGHDVCVYNRTSAKAERWLEHYGARYSAEGGGDGDKGSTSSASPCYSSAPTPRAAVMDSDFIFICLGGDNDVRELLDGEDGVFAGVKRGAIIVDHTTTSARFARESHSQASERDIGFVDAPVSGGEKGAQTGKLSVMCGGDLRYYEQAQPLMDCYAERCVLMGLSGAGQLSKMVNQICIAGVLQGLSEGLHFAQCAGLDSTKLLSIISKGAAQSWQMDNRGESMTEGSFNFGFATKWMLKDLGFCLEEAERNGANLTLVKEIAGYYEELQTSGHALSDSSALITRLNKA